MVTPLAPSISDQKKASVTEAADIKKAAISGNLSASQHGGTSLADSIAAFNFENADPLTRERMFGPGANDAAVRHSRQYDADLNTLQTNRNGAQILGDSLAGIGQGVVNGVGGIGSIGVGLVNDEAGAGFSQAVADLSAGIGDFKSDAMNDRSELYNRVSALRSQDIDAQYQQNVAEGDPFAGLKRFGSEVYHGTADVLNDPAVFGDVVSQGVGSIVPTVVAALLSGGSVPVIAGVTGAMGAGGAYQEASQTIMGMSHEDLLENSPAYVQRLQDGMTPEQAKQSIANAAGLTGGAIAAPIAAIGGRATAGFASNPLRVAGEKVMDRLGDAGKTAIKEYGEEFVQGGAEQLGANIGVRNFGDSTLDVLAGVGEAAAVEGLAGLGTAGALQTPAAVVRTGADLGNRARAAVNTATSSPVQNANTTINQAAQAASAAVAETVAATPNEPVATDTPAGIDPAIIQTVSDLESLGSVNTDELSQNADTLKRLFGDDFDLSNPVDRMALIEGLRDQIFEKNAELTPEEGLRAVRLLRESVNRYADIANRDIPEAIAALPEDSAIRQAYTEAQSAAAQIMQDADIQSIFDAMAEMEKSSIENIEVNSPEVAEIVASVAAADIEAITPEKAKAAIEQIEAAGINLPAIQEAPLRTVVAFDEIQAEHRQEEEKIRDHYKPNGSTEKRANIDLVYSEIVDTFNKNNKLPSAYQHLKNIQNALTREDIQVAQTAYEDLVNFAQHMQNKVSAANQSYAGQRGEKVSFEGYGPHGWGATGEVYINAKSNNSLYLMDSIVSEARGLKKIADSVAREFGAVGIQPREITSVVPAWPSITYQPFTDTRSLPAISQRRDVAVRPDPTTAPVVEAAPEAPVVETEPVVEEVPTPVSEAIAEPVVESVVQEEASKPAPEKEEVKTEPKPEPKVEPKAETVSETPKFFLPEMKKEKTDFTTALGETFKSKFVDLNAGNKFNQAKTRLFQIGKDPIKVLKTIVDNNGKKNIDALLNKTVPTAVKKAMSSMLGGTIPRLKNQINSIITPEILKTIEKNPNLVSSKQYGFMLFVDPETKKFSEPVLNAMAIAGVEWATTLRRSLPQKADNISKTTGIPIEALDADAIRLFNSGQHTDMAARAISQRIGEILGHEPSNDTPIDFGQNLFDKLAVHVLASMEVMPKPLIQKSEERTIRWKPEQAFRDATPSTEIDSETPGENFYTVSVIQPAAGITNENRTGLADILKNFNEFVSDILAPEKEKSYSIGEPITAVRFTQKRNKNIKLSKAQVELEKKISSIPFTANLDMWNFQQALGGDNLIKLLGYKNFKADELHDATAATLAGKNKSIEVSILTMNDISDGMTAYADANGVDVSEVPVYFDTAISAVSRLHMNGTSVQNNKYLREMLVMSKTTYDLTNEDQLTDFRYGLGQALGVKTHKKAQAKVFADLEAAITKNREAIDLLKEHVRGNEFDADKFASLMPAPSEMKFLHGLLNAAKYEVAEEDGNLSNFDSALSIELDGVTDGPLNALVHFWGGEIDPEYIRMLEAGGRYLGKTYQNLADYASQLGNKDIYEKTVDTFNEFIREELESDNGTEANKIYRAFTNAEMMKFVTYGDSPEAEYTYVSTRDSVKNPLTVFLYASGIAGINDKVIGAYEDKLYAAISDVLSSGGFTRELAAHPLFEGMTRADIEQFFGVPMTEMLHRRWKVSDAFRSRVMRHYSKPLHRALNARMSGMAETMRTIITASQVHTEIEKEIFNTTIREVVQESLGKAGFTKTGEITEAAYGRLTPNQYNEALQAAAKYGATYAFPDQTVSLSAKEARMSSAKSAETPDGRFYANLRLPQPRDVGVKAGANINISVGDANTVKTAYTAAGSVVMDRSLPIFDGIDVPISNVREVSKHLNKSVEMNWETNPMQAVWDRWDNLLKTIPSLDSLSDAAIVNMLNSVAGREDAAKVIEKGRKFAQDQLKAYLNTLNNTLKNTTDLVTARKKVEKEFSVNNEHMAAVGEVYDRDGFTAETADEVAAELSRRIDTELDRKFTAGTLDAALHAELLDAGRAIETEAGQVISLAPNQISRVLRASKNVPNHFRRIAPKLVTALNTGARIYIGTPEALDAMKRMNGGDLRPVKQGQYDPNTGSIYLANDATETMVHELIHAATFDKFAEFFQNSDNLSDVDRATIQRLNDIMNDVVYDGDYDLFSENEETMTAYGNMLTAVNKAPTPAHALSEFVAWNMANENLVAKMQNTRLKNPLARATKEIIKFIKKMFFGVDTNVGTDVLSNIRFNLEILASTNMTTDPDGRGTWSSLDLNTGSRSSQVAQQYRTKMRDLVNGRLAQKYGKVHAARRTQASSIIGQREAHRLNKAGFALTKDDEAAFRAMYAVFSTDIQLNPSAMSQVNSLFKHYLENITVENFMVDTDSTNPNDRKLAEDQYNAVFGDKRAYKDSQRRSYLLPMFLALSQVNDDFRNALDRVGLPKINTIQAGSTDELLNTIGRTAMDYVTARLAGQTKETKSMSDALDNLVDSLAEVENDHSDSWMTKVGQIPTKANAHIAAQIGDATTRLDRSLRNIERNSRNKAIKTAAFMAGTALAPFNKKAAEARGNLITGFLNKSDFVPHMARDFFNEMRGMTLDNEGVVGLAKKAKSFISGLRQDYRETTPKAIKNLFSNKMTKGAWTTLHTALGRTDIISLLGSMSLADMLSVVSSDSNLTKAINDAETELARVAGSRAVYYRSHARRLAEYMIDKQTTHKHLLRNAEAISRLLGTANLPAQSPELVQLIDSLISMYAFEHMPANEKQAFRDIMKQEPTGLIAALKQLEILKKEESKKTHRGSKSHLNGWKGHIPAEPKNTQVYMIAPVDDEAKLVRQGFELVKRYSHRGNDGELLAYYRSPIGTQNTYQQGAMQTVARTYNGVQLTTGRSVNGTVGYVITDPTRIATIMKNPSSNPHEIGIPVFSTDGKIIALEMQKDQSIVGDQRLNTDFAEMVGAWRGRQIEEQYAYSINKELVNNLKERYDADIKLGRDNEYVNVATSSDPVHKQMWDNVPAEMRRDVEAVFGKKTFYVRKDMLNNALGYRSASIGDAFTNQTRLSPVMHKHVVNFLVQMMGPKAYRYIVGAEKLIQTAVAEAKNIIVIRSVVVPGVNIASNFLQLASRGVPLKMIGKASLQKLAETNQYAANRKKLIQLELELEINKGNTAKEIRIKGEIQAIKDSHRRMSIWPVIEQFSTIAEDLSPVDGSLMGGKWIDAVEKAVDTYLPGPLQTAGKYAIMSRDTALYKLMDQATQYGDFIAKSILYDHLMQSGVSEKDATRDITDEFVNYDYLPGRTRTYMDSLGVTWFWNFKVRSIKIALNLIRDNPLFVFLSVAGITQFGSFLELGTPITDNLIGKVADGTLDYSVGWDMMWSAPSLTPIGHVIY